MTGTKRCAECGSDTFHVHLGVEQMHAHPGDPRAPGYREVAETLECTECGATYSA